MHAPAYTKNEGKMIHPANQGVYARFDHSPGIAMAADRPMAAPRANARVFTIRGVPCMSSSVPNVPVQARGFTRVACNRLLGGRLLMRT